MKEVTISTELMSEVMGEKVHRCGFTDEFLPNDLHYVSASPVGCCVINRYEFMHRCKEYMYGLNYIICVGRVKGDSIHWCHIFKHSQISKIHSLFGNSEFEAIIKATQWVIDQKER